MQFGHRSDQLEDVVFVPCNVIKHLCLRPANKSPWYLFPGIKQETGCYLRSFLCKLIKVHNANTSVVDITIVVSFYNLNSQWGTQCAHVAMSLVGYG